MTIQAHTFMVDTPKNAYVAQASYTSGASLPNDVSQFVGGPLSVVPSNCQDLFSSATGLQYCAALCINTCPELDPTLGSVNATMRQINATNLYLASLANAINSAQSDLSVQTQLEYVSGATTFVAPAGTTAASIAAAVNYIKTGIVPAFGNSMNATCTSTTSSITCTFGAMIQYDVITSFSASQSPPYAWASGYLQQVLNPMVQLQFSQYAAQQALTALNATLAANTLFSVTITVPQRFINVLGSPFPLSAFAQALSTSTGLPVANILDAWTIRSGVAGAATIAVFGAPYNGISSSAIQAALLSLSPVFTVTLGNGQSVPIYISGTDTVQPAVASLSVIEVVVQNSALYGSQPFNPSDAADFDNSVVSFLDGLSVQASDLLGTKTLQQPGSTAGRRAVSDAVILGLIVDAASTLLTALDFTAFNGFLYDNTPSAYISSTAVTVPKFEDLLLALQLASQKKNVAALSANQTTALNDLIQYGAPPSVLAIGAYGWTDLNIEPDGSTLPPMTNLECTHFTTMQSNPATLKANLIAKVALFLPVPSTAITIQYPVTCGPAHPLQTRSDQASVFSVTGISIEARYTLFAKTASYVTYLNTSVDHNLQTSELLARLSQVNVRNAIEEALRLLFLETDQQFYTQQANSLQSSLPSTAGSGFPIIIIAAAAGGAILLILLILIILIRRRRGYEISAIIFVYLLKLYFFQRWQER